MILDDIVQHLLADSDVTYFTGTRIRAAKAKQSDAAPFIIVVKASDEPVYHTGGSAGFGATEFEFSLAGCTNMQAEEMALKLKAAAATFASENSNIQGVFTSDEGTFFIADRADSEKGKHVARQTWKVWHTT